MDGLVELLVGQCFHGHALWERVTSDGVGAVKSAREVFRSEMHGHVADFLFPNGKDSGCVYLRFTDAARNMIFRNGLSVRTPKGTLARWCLDADAEIELFLSPYWVGVISIRLAWHPRDAETVASALEMNYRLAQHRLEMRYKLGMVHPSEDLEMWAQIPADSRERIKLPPSADAEFEARVGCAGGWFDLVELKDWLLAPIRGQLRSEIRRQFGVYTVVRCDKEANFSACLDDWMVCAANLAETLEAWHAGAEAGHVAVPHGILNRRHLAAVGCQGAAHLIADQGIEFDPQRVVMVRDKYFAPYLLALFQAHYCERTAAALAGMALRTGQDDSACGNELARVWTEFLAFDGECNHVHSSDRESVNRWYVLARRGLGVSESRERLVGVLRELDGFCRLRAAQASRESLRESAAKANHSVEAIEHMQVKMEWVEIAVLSVYSIYIIHYLGQDLRFEGTYRAVWLILGSAATAGLALATLQPWRKHAAQNTPMMPIQSWLVGKLEGLTMIQKTVFLLCAITVLLALYIGFGLLFFRESGEAPAH